MPSLNDCVNSTCRESVDVHVALNAYPSWLVIFLWLLTSIFSVQTILGNLLVLLAYKLERNIRRQLSNKFIVSLAITDLIIGMEGFPLLTVYVVGRERWPLGHLLCQFWLFLDYTLCLVSILNVLLITIDRYGSVCYPAKYRIWQTRSRVRIFIFMSWVVPCVLFGMMIFAWEPMTGQGMDDSGKCYAPFLNDPYVNMAMYIIYYWTTLVAMSVLYRGIHTAAKALEDKSKARERQTIALLLGQRCMAQVGVGMLLHSSASDEDVEINESFFHPQPTVDYGYATGEYGTEIVRDSSFAVTTTAASMANTGDNNLTRGGYEQLKDDEAMTGMSDSDEKTPLNVPRIVAPSSAPSAMRIPESPAKEKNFLERKLLYKEFGEGEDEECEDVSVSLLPLIDRSESKISRISGAGSSPSPSASTFFPGSPSCPTAQGQSVGKRASGHRRALVPMNSYGGVASIASAAGTRKLICSASWDENKICYNTGNWPSRSAKTGGSQERIFNDAGKPSKHNSLSHDSTCSLEFYDNKKGSAGSLYGDTSLHSVFDLGGLTSTADAEKFSYFKESTAGSMESSIISTGQGRFNGDLMNLDPISSCTVSSQCSTGSSRQNIKSGSVSMRSRLSTKSDVDKRSLCDRLSVTGAVAPSSSSPAGLVHLADASGDSAKCVGQHAASARPSVQITISADTEQLTPIIEEDKSTTTPVHSPANSAPPVAELHAVAQSRSSSASSSGIGNETKGKRRRDKVNHLTVPSSSGPKYGLGFIGRRKASVAAKKGAGRVNRRKTETYDEEWQRASWQSTDSSIYNLEINDKKRANRRLTGVSNIDDDEDSGASGTANRAARASSSTAEQGAKSKDKNNGWLMNLFSNPISILNRKRKVTKAERRARKAFRTITVIVGTFALFWSPYYIVATVYGFCPDCVPPPLFLTSYYLCYLNSSVNPFAYAFANRLFRKTFIRILRGDLRRT